MNYLKVLSLILILFSSCDKQPIDRTAAIVGNYEVTEVGMAIDTAGQLVHLAPITYTISIQKDDSAPNTVIIDNFCQCGEHSGEVTPERYIAVPFTWTGFKSSCIGQAVVIERNDQTLSYSYTISRSGRWATYEGTAVKK